MSEFNQQQAAECYREAELLRKEALHYIDMQEAGRVPMKGSRSYAYKAQLATERAKYLEELAAAYLL